MPLLFPSSPSRCRFLVLASLIVLFAAGSCQAPDITLDLSSFASSSEAELLSGADPVRIIFPSSGGSATMELGATRKWEVAPVNRRASWCEVTPSSGLRGTTKVTFTAGENDAYGERSATFILSCEDVTKTVIVTQKQLDAIVIGSTRYEVGPEGMVLGIDVASNLDYSVKVSQDARDWITPVSTKGLDRNVLIFDVARNETMSKRYGAIVLSGGQKQETIHVYQAGEAPTVVVSSDTCMISASGGLFDVQVRSNLDVTAEIPQGCDWVREVRTKSISTSTFVFEVGVNDSFDGRSTEIMFLAEGFKESVYLIQNGDVPTIKAGDGMCGLPYEESVFGVTVVSNIDFRCSIPEDSGWIHHLGTKSAQSSLWQFSAEENPIRKKREGEIVFYSEDYGLSDTLYVVQGAAPDVVLIELSGGPFAVPVFRGQDVVGTMDCGDGREAAYDSTAVMDNPLEERTAVFRINGSESLTIPSMTGVRHLDLTKYNDE